MSELVTSTVETITPELAAEYLTRNKHNRPIKRTAVDALEHAIRTGQWRLNGTAITFDYNGALADGQHRLHAVVNAGRAITSLVVRGVAPDSFATLDNGVPRSARDTLSLADMETWPGIASGLRLLDMHETGNMERTSHYGRRILNAETLELARRFARLADVAYLATPGLRKLVSPAPLLAFAYLASEESTDLAADFLSAVETGANLDTGDPRLLLRNFLVGPSARTTRNIRAYIRLGIVIKAWNYWRTEHKVMFLTYKPGESFPVIYHRGPELVAQQVEFRRLKRERG